MIVTVEIEHLEEFLAVLLGEDWVFGDNVPPEDYLPVFLNILLSALQHFKNNDLNIEGSYCILHQLKKLIITPTLALSQTRTRSATCSPLRTPHYFLL